MVDDFLSNLDKPPSRSSAFLWADYIELRCLIHPDRYFSLDGAEEALQEAEDYQADAEERQLTNNTVGLDKLDRRWSECETIIARRAHLLGDDYPFELSSTFRGIELREDGDQDFRRWYRFLLLSSSLQYVPRHNAVTSAFELASLEIFKHLTPRGAEIHGFWPSNTRYPTGKPERLTKLSSDLRAIPLFANDSFKGNDRGDAGIDLVAWHPMGDERNRIPVALAQCGCSVEDWKTKPTSTGRDKLNSIIHLSTTDWSRFYFMPLDLCGPSGKWFDGTDGDLPAVIIVDRDRFMGLARSNALRLPAEATTLVGRLDSFRYV